jgi:hypothetical protein
MPRGQGLGAQFFGLAEQETELDPVVAVDAGVGSSAPQLLLDKVLDHLFFESLLQVDHVVGDSEMVRHPAGILDIIDGTAAAERSFPVLSLIPKMHRQPDDFIPFLLQKGRGRGAVHPPAHGDDDSFFFI